MIDDVTRNNTVVFYEENADVYFASSRNVEMTHIYPHFLNLLPEKAIILDAGSGSGRDTKYFLENGYSVSAFDGSKRLAQLASQYTNIQVKHKTFETIEYIEQFYAVWACASLLHLNRVSLITSFKNLRKACKRGAFIYASFKVATR